MFLALVVISASSSAGRLITQSSLFWIMARISTIRYLPVCPLLVQRLLKVFSKLPLVQKSSNIPLEISLASIYSSSSSEYPNQQTLYCSILLPSTLQYSITFLTSYLSCMTSSGFTSWHCRNMVELLIT